jgi:hypothetical protein
MSFNPEEIFVCTDIKCRKPKIILKPIDYKDHMRCEPDPSLFKDFKK